MTGLDIKIARIRAGLKQFELAQRARVRPNELSMIENDRIVVSPEKLGRIVAALDQEPGEAVYANAS